MKMRTKEFDGLYNNPQPKTDRFCARCQKDIRPATPARAIHLIAGGSTILHPEDESLYTPDGGDLGAHLLGMDCARRIGMEWSVPA